MWPGLREGDRLIFSPLGRDELRGLAGQIGVARSPQGLVAHRIRRVFGLPGRERLVLGGDLSPDDPVRDRSEILGVAKALYRPGQGFVDLPGPLDVGPAGGAVLRLGGRLWTWAQRRAATQAG